MENNTPSKPSYVLEAFTCNAPGPHGPTLLPGAHGVGQRIDRSGAAQEAASLREYGEKLGAEADHLLYAAWMASKHDDQPRLVAVYNVNTGRRCWLQHNLDTAFGLTMSPRAGMVIATAIGLVGMVLLARLLPKLPVIGGVLVPLVVLLPVVLPALFIRSHRLRRRALAELQAQMETRFRAPPASSAEEGRVAHDS